MGVNGRPGLSAVQKEAVWFGWRSGQSSSEIGRALGCASGSVFNVLRSRGGIVPAPRFASARALSFAEREEISRGLVAALPFQEIGRRLGRGASTISREVAHNNGRAAYRAGAAQARADALRRRPKLCLLAGRPELAEMVSQKLCKRWSPKQVSSWLRNAYPADATMWVSHETIYKTLFIQARGALKRELVAYLRTRRSIRRPKAARHSGQGRGQIVDAISIRERPPEADDRAVPGHWEGDLIAGSHNSYIATLVERRSRFVMLVKLPGKDSQSVVSALVNHVQNLPKGLMTSLTWDRGMELAQHRRFTIATDVAVYFCDPKSPWQRGSNENTNGLLRQYFPKGTNLSAHSQDELDAVALELNTRPRLTLGFQTPGDTLNHTVASTG